MLMGKAIYYSPRKFLMQILMLMNFAFRKKKRKKMKEEKIRRSDDKILTTKNDRTVESFFAFRNGNNNLKKR